MTQDKLEYQFKKAFLEQESEKYIDYLCEPRTKKEVYTANIPKFDDPLF